MWSLAFRLDQWEDAPVFDAYRDSLFPRAPQLDRTRVASVDGMAGPEAYSVLAPLGCWPPLINPLLVKEVVVEPGDNPWTMLSLRFIDA